MISIKDKKKIKIVIIKLKLGNKHLFAGLSVVVRCFFQ